jgi:ribokinase
VLARGGRLSLDPNVRADAGTDLRERTARLASAAHVVFPSEGELAALGLDAGALAGRGAVVCETRGRSGALLFARPAGSDPVFVRVAERDEVDATGAGDTFAAAFVTAFRDGADALSAAAFACETAARSVGVMGAMEAPVEPRAA